MSEFDKWWEHHKDARDSLNFYDAKYVYESQQAKIDELQARVDEALIEIKNQLTDEDFCDMQRPDCYAMLYSLRNIKDILKGNKDENN